MNIFTNRAVKSRKIHWKSGRRTEDLKYQAVNNKIIPDSSGMWNGVNSNVIKLLVVNIMWNIMWNDQLYNLRNFIINYKCQLT